MTRRPGGVTVLFAALSIVLGVMSVQNLTAGTSQASPLRIVAGIILALFSWIAFECAIESHDMDERNGR